MANHIGHRPITLKELQSFQNLLSIWELSYWWIQMIQTSRTSNNSPWSMPNKIVIGNVTYTSIKFKNSFFLKYLQVLKFCVELKTWHPNFGSSFMRHFKSFSCIFRTYASVNNPENVSVNSILNNINGLRIFKNNLIFNGFSILFHFHIFRVIVIFNCGRCQSINDTFQVLLFHGFEKSNHVSLLVTIINPFKNSSFLYISYLKSRFIIENISHVMLIQCVRQHGLN